VNSDHLGEDRLRSIATAKLELDEKDEEHLLNCSQCRKRFLELSNKLREQ